MLSVVVSAYACFPNHGSEPEVGYRWITEMSSRYKNVTVLTSFWSYERAGDCFPSNVKLVPLGYRNDFKYKDAKRGLFQLFYLYWVVLCFLHVRQAMLRGERFDYALSLTFGGIHMPSALALTGLPTAWGPIGGEICNLRLAYDISARLFVRMAIMKVGILLEFLNPIWLVSFFGAKRIYVKWQGTNLMLPESRRIRVMRENGMATSPDRDAAMLTMGKNIVVLKSGHVQMLYAGRLKLHKGTTLLYPILRRLRKLNFDASLDVVGGGELAPLMQKISDAEGINAFQFLGRVEHDVLMSSYSKYNIFLFPSMNDPSPHVVHEALSKGCIVLAYAESGAADIARSAGMPVIAKVKTKEQMISAFAEAVVGIGEGRLPIDFRKYEEYLSTWTYAQVIQTNLKELDVELAGCACEE